MNERAEILGVPVDSVTMQEAVQRVEDMIANGEKSALVATANAEMILRATHDAELMRILKSAELVVPDGAGAVWAARHLGHAMPERVAGYDLVQELLRIAPKKKYRVYFFGSAPGVADKAKKKAELLYPGLCICGTRNGFFKDSDIPNIIHEIQQAKPDILFAALGVPKQEKWLAAHKQEIGASICIGVGGTLDVMAGVMKRAPLWMQKARLEWLFRGILQPTRAKRLLALPKFVLKVHRSRR